MNERDVFVALQNGEPVGALGISMDPRRRPMATDHGVFVLEGYRQRGIELRLGLRLEAYLKEYGFMILVSSFEESIEAQRFAQGIIRRLNLSEENITRYPGSQMVQSLKIDFRQNSLIELFKKLMPDDMTSAGHSESSLAMLSSEERQKKIAALEEIMKGEGGEENIREIKISYDEGLKRFVVGGSLEDGEMVKINLNGLQNDYGKLRPGLTPILDSIVLKLGLEESESAKERIFTLLTQAFLSNNQDWGLPIYIKINNQKKIIEVFDLNLIEFPGSSQGRGVVKSGEEVVGAKVKIDFAGETTEGLSEGGGRTSQVMMVVDEEFIKEIGDMKHENDEGHYKDDIGDIKWIDKSGKGFNVKIQRKTLETIILELIDNGIDHGEGDKVDITILRIGDMVEIRVTNKGYVDFDGLRLKLISLGINGQLRYENNHWVVLPEYQKNRNFVVREPDLPKGAKLFYLVQGLSFQLDPDSKEGQRELQKKKEEDEGKPYFLLLEI